MSNTKKGKRPLVAERRYPKAADKPKKKAAPKRRKRTPAPKRRGNILTRLVRWMLRLIWVVTSRATLVGLVVLGLAVGYVYITLPDLEDLLDGRARGSVTLVDRDGAVFAWRGDQFGGAVTATSVSPALKNAVVATEDKRFYRHFGLSPRGIASAVRINLNAGRGPLSGNGGSTITQQTAKLLCLGVPFDVNKWEDEAAYENDCRQGSLWRKAKDAGFAIGMEIAYSKEHILTSYLNRAYLGAGARGFQAAGQRYFGTSAAELSAPQAAMLVGLLPAPSAFAPTRSLEVAQGRAALVIGLMEAQGYLTAAQADDARAGMEEQSAEFKTKGSQIYLDAT